MFGPSGERLVSFEELRAKVNADLADLALHGKVKSSLKPTRKKEKLNDEFGLKATGVGAALINQPGFFDEQQALTKEERLEAAWQEHKRRAIAGVAVIQGVWDETQEAIDKFGVLVWFPATEEKRPCCSRIDSRDEAIRQRPRKFEEHVLSYLHVAALFGLDDAEFRAFAKKRDKATIDGRDAHHMGRIMERE